MYFVYAINKQPPLIFAAAMTVGGEAFKLRAAFYYYCKYPFNPSISVTTCLFVFYYYFNTEVTNK